MREIRFRCFYRDKMYFVDELYFHKDGSFGVGFIYMDGNMVSPDSEHVKGIMEYTGLKDNNGKEIYEGDILQYLFNEVDEIDQAIVIFDEGAWCSKTDDHQSEYLFEELQSNAFSYIYIIGNIYENPELI